MNKLFARNNSLKYFVEKNLKSQQKWSVTVIKKQFNNQSSGLNFAHESLDLKQNKNKIENFKKLYNLINILIDNLCDMKWIPRPNSNRKLTDEIELILKHNESNPLLITVMEKIKNHGEFNAINKYFLNNLEKLSAKEQAILFRLMNFLNRNANNPLILKLEKLYYNQLDRFDVNDFINYNRGFYLLRLLEQSYFESLSKSAEIVNKKVLGLIENIGNQSNEEANSLDKIFNEIKISSSGIPLVLSAIRLYMPILTTECQSAYYNILLEKAKKIEFSNENINELADIILFVETVFDRNDKNVTKIISEKNLNRYFEEKFELISKNFVNLLENFDRFDRFMLKLNANFSRVQKIEKNAQFLENVKQNLINSKDNRNIYKYMYSAFIMKNSLKTNYFSTQIMREKYQKIFNSMDFYTIQNVIKFFPQKYLFEYFKTNKSIQIIKLSKENKTPLNDNIICSLTSHYRFLFNDKTADCLKHKELYSVYSSLNFKYFNQNLSEILLSYEKNLDYFLNNNINTDVLFNNLKNLNKYYVNQNYVMLRKIYSNIFNRLILKLTLNPDEREIKPVIFSNNLDDNLILKEFNHDFLTRNYVNRCVFYVKKLDSLLKTHSDNYHDYIDLSDLNLQNIHNVILNLKQIFEYWKLANQKSKNEKLYQLVNFVLKKLAIYLNEISTLVEKSDYYSPKLNKDLISLFLHLCEMACDPFFEYKEENPYNIVQLYENLFRFIKLYSSYDIDCKEANISDEQKNDLEFYLTKMYQTIKHYDSGLESEPIVSKIYHLANLDILNEEILEDFQNNFEKIHKTYENTGKKFHFFTYGLIKRKFPEFKLDTDIELTRLNFSDKISEVHENFLKIYGDYLHEKMELDQFTSKNYLIVFDSNGLPLKNTETRPDDSFEILVQIIGNSSLFKNTKKLKSLNLKFSKQLQTNFPSILLFENELEGKTIHETKQLFEEKIIEYLKNFNK